MLNTLVDAKESKTKGQIPPEPRIPAPRLCFPSPVVTVLGRFFLAGTILFGSILGFRFLAFPLLVELVSGDVWEIALRRGGVLLSAIAGFILSVRVCDRGAFPEFRVPASSIVLGTLSGAAVISVTITSLFVTGHYQMVSWRGLQGAYGPCGTILVAAMLEDIVFRGFLFQRVEEALGSVWALISVSALFGALHLSNEGATLMTLLSVTLIGAFWTAVFVASRNLWAIGLHHFAWNLAIFWSGAPLSGLENWRNQAPFETIVRGSTWISGGSFGPENSILTLVVVGLALGGVLHWAKRNGWLRPALVWRG